MDYSKRIVFRGRGSVQYMVVDYSNLDENQNLELTTVLESYIVNCSSRDSDIRVLIDFRYVKFYFKAYLFNRRKVKLLIPKISKSCNVVSDNVTSGLINRYRTFTGSKAPFFSDITDAELYIME